MIQDLTFITINGPKESFDTMIQNHLSKYDIHLEDAQTELYSAEQLRPFKERNPYQDYINKIEEWGKVSEVDLEGQNADQNNLPNLSFEEIKALIQKIDNSLAPIKESNASLEEIYNEKNQDYQLIAPFVGIDYPIEDILSIKNVNFRFGKFTQENYQIFMDHIYGDTPSIFVKGQTTDDTVYGVYFTSYDQRQKVHTQYLSMNFHKIFIPEETYEGTPADEASRLAKERDKTLVALEGNQAEVKKVISTYHQQLSQALVSLKRYSDMHQAHDYAALTHEMDSHKETQYILCGWLENQEALALKTELEQRDDTSVIIQTDESAVHTETPTKIKNPSIFKPFELLVTMYGVPDYDEIDPTILTGITYPFFFGMMFGDVGQGLVLAAVGAYMWFSKKMPFGGIFLWSGLWATFFGFMYGSVFGFEGVVPAYWLHPMSAMTELPIIGTLNTVFVVAIAMGMFMILLTILLNIIKEWRSGNRGEALLDKNGLAGFAFYGVIVYAMVMLMTGRTLIGGTVLGLAIGLPLLAIAFKEPIINAVEGVKDEEWPGWVMYLVQAFFELFETILSLFSNTISYVRVGAFAVIHVAFMEVVLMLSGHGTGNINWIAVVLGNLFVMGLEGLVVFIQVLRLEYYEIYSHFYSGTGKAFKSLKDERK